MAQIWNDPDITVTEYDPTAFKRPTSLNDKLTVEQIIIMSNQLWQLHDKFVQEETDVDSKPLEWQEWHHFLDQSYALGFVCHDASNAMDDGTPVGHVIDTMESNKDVVRSLSLRQMRQVIHYVVRSEQWRKAGNKKGEGTLYRFLKAGLADDFAKRLSGNP